MAYDGSMYALHDVFYPKFVTIRSCILHFTLLLGVAGAEEVDLRFRIYVPEQGGILTEQTQWNALPELYLQIGGSYRRLASARGQASRYFRYKGDPELTLYTREVEVRRLEGEGMEEGDEAPLREFSSYRPYARVRIPETWKETMIMLRPEERDSQGLCWAVAMNIDPSQLPKGKGTFYNASSRTLALTVAGQAHVIRSGQRLVLNRSQVQERQVGNMVVGRMVLAEQDQERGIWKPRYTRPVYVKPHVSNLFLISDAGNERVRVRVVYGEEGSS